MKPCLSTIAMADMRRERGEPLLLAEWSEAVLLHGHVHDTHSARILSYTARPLAEKTSLNSAGVGTLEEFLFERYSAFTTCWGLQRRFRVWHPPWQHAHIEATIHEDSLLGLTGVWHQEATFIGAHFAPGFKDVWMGRPRFLRN
jgi:uncharacterized protein YqjF (DUF2071 family)